MWLESVACVCGCRKLSQHGIWPNQHVVLEPQLYFSLEDEGVDGLENFKTVQYIWWGKAKVEWQRHEPIMSMMMIRLSMEPQVALL